MDEVRQGGGSASGTATHERALRLLSRRPLSVEELRRTLIRAGHSGQDVDSAIGRLQRAGYLDDRRLAEQVFRSHASRGHAPRRARQALARRGVAATCIRAAEEELRRESGADPSADLRRQVRSLLGAEGGAVDERRLRRVYNRLLRAGFEETELRAELEPFLPSEHDARPGGARSRGRRITGTDDDLT